MRERLTTGIRGERTKAGWQAPPRNTQFQTIRALADALGIAPPSVTTEAEASYLIDDLRHQEKVAKRAARKRLPPGGELNE